METTKKWLNEKKNWKWTQNKEQLLARTAIALSQYGKISGQGRLSQHRLSTERQRQGLRD